MTLALQTGTKIPALKRAGIGYTRMYEKYIGRS